MAEILDRVAAYPNVSFTVIINPFNGPGLDDLPDESYQGAIPTLTCHANVRVLGYVHTTWAKRDIGLVCKDIDKYGQWPERSGNPDLKVRGIFVDETPNVYSAASESYLAKLGEQVKEMPGGDDNIVRLLHPVQISSHCPMLTYHQDHPQPRMCPTQNIPRATRLNGHLRGYLP